jgi:hypothetical protein
MFDFDVCVYVCVYVAGVMVCWDCLGVISKENTINIKRQTGQRIKGKQKGIGNELDWMGGIADEMKDQTGSTARYC